MIRNPLDDEFDLPSDFDDRELDAFIEVVLPQDPKLKHIVDFAMQAYKQQMDDVIHIEPKNRLKFYEVAERFLNQAKDAMHKIETLEIEREKLRLKAKSAKAKPSVPGQKPVAEGDDEPEQQFSRTALLEAAMKLKAVK